MMLGLQNRQQQITIEHISSSCLTSIMSGVPQAYKTSFRFLFCLQMRTTKRLTSDAMIIKYAEGIVAVIPVSPHTIISSTINDEEDKRCSNNGLRSVENQKHAYF